MEAGGVIYSYFNSPMRGPVKWVFYRLFWEIFAMVSIQIWVTRFHIRCTGELGQVCLAAVIGSPFFSTGLESDAKYTGRNNRCFCPGRSVVKWHHSGACCQCPPGLHNCEEASREQVMLLARRAVAARWWKQPLLEQACYGFCGCNHRWLPKKHDSSTRTRVNVTM